MGGPPASDEIRLSPREERFLKAFVRRQVWPLVAGAALLWLLAIPLVLASGWIVVEPAPPPAAPEPPSEATAPLPPDPVAPILERVDAEAARRLELERHLKQAAERLARLEQRLSGTASRIEKIESQLAAKPSLPASAAPAPAGAPGADALASLRTRMFNLEKRQDRQEAMREGFERSLLERIDSAEALRVQRDQQEIESQKSILNRLYNIEARIEALEAR